MKKVRYGLIGTGSTVRSGHIPNIKQLDEIEIRAVCDTNEENLGKALGMLKTRPRVHADYRDLLADPEVDAVLIATPDDTHRT